MVKAFCSVAWLIHHCESHTFSCLCTFDHFCLLQLLLSTAGAKQQLPQQVHRLLATHACKGTLRLLSHPYYILILKHSTQRFLNELSDDVYHINTISQNLLHGAPETDLKPSEPSFVHIITVNEKAPS